ncbi:MAG: hypothetical protein IJR14_07680, partial [Synergistaceae bacterium]|nr:hypothetical protein [Synergistaceae bacterium]
MSMSMSKDDALWGDINEGHLLDGDSFALSFCEACPYGDVSGYVAECEKGLAPDRPGCARAAIWQKVKDAFDACRAS